ncbi:Mucin-associated surface protein (MASP) [Trypanosoma cruzi]|uniref:Mucin-associated surface protein (MASP), putative n=2 Tax=Trypanosoma cruzi TaxID=5693 RepID=Q4E5V1_TRYCC|nr:mucin-associated surface protein (MASP), putative [Trypanosoma cruzi]EAO00162.1 mucin-associated surface protein (MASP), putative [Trypanosoma cruzi]PWV21240.1 Mucin-associated surface protein (MASP) [Trypanosoma cruzi]RNC41621.1 mucin-associated surface protein (MASP) [Trypanosoma cruzi]|eukprot:XP_822013.1 mucin-associated surface protein (MASP) [Trypanosoma cruzi strain CL Brener]
MAMMTGRVLLVCALCVLWCGAGCGFCEGTLEDEFCNKSYVEALSLLANKTDDEIKKKYCKQEDEKATCLKTLRSNIADALEKEKAKEDNAAHRESDISRDTGASVGSPTTKSSKAAGANTAVLSSPPPLNVEGGFDAQIHGSAGGAGHQQHSDDVRSEEEQRNHPESGRCSEGQDALGECSHVPAGDAAAEGSHQHSVDAQGKTIHKKGEETTPTGLKSTEARDGTDGAPAPPQDPPNTTESHEDKSRRVAAPDTIPADNTSPGSNQEQTSQSSSPSGSETTGSSDKEDREKNSKNAQISDTPLKDEEQHRESTAGSKDATTVESAAEQRNTTTPGDSDGSTAVSHTTSPLLLVVVACAAAAAVVAA